MIVIDTSVVIERSASLCFSIIARGYFEHVRRWRYSLQELKQLTEGDVKLGTQSQETETVAGRKVDRTVEVSEFDPDKVFTLKRVGGDGTETHYVSSYRFNPVSRYRCEVTHHLELDRSGLSFKLLGMFVRRSLRNELDMAVGRRVKATVEELTEPSGVMTASQKAMIRPATRGPSR